MTTCAENKKARFDYDILETFEAGLVLSGQEVKSIRTQSLSLKGGFITFHNNKAFLINIHIPPYKYAGKLAGYDPLQNRTLLLNKKEFEYLKTKSQEKGLTIVPLSVYTKGRHIKLEIALVKGKKQYDKREVIKKREVARELRRSLKIRN
jgi:SsrA-binding protein